jgi:CPA2 family monovalent cation:H+ antiporter-2
MMLRMHVFDNAAVVFAAAALLVWLLHRWKQSSIVAYLVLGLAAGPAALDLVPSGEVVDQLAEIGVVLLLFFLGLEFHVRELKRMAGVALGGTALQLLLTTAVMAAAGALLGWALVPSVVLGYCVALSSTAIVMKAFEERKEDDGAIAKNALALLLGQDLAAMAALALCALLPASEGGPRGTSPWLLLCLPALFFAARATLPRLFAKAALARQPEIFALSSLAACFLVAAGAHRLGASLALGAFLGGMVFADTPFAAQIRADLATVKSVALGLFFLSIGALVDPIYVRDHALLLAGAILFIVVAKTIVATLVLRLFRRPWSLAAAAGLSISQVGEFAFVLASGTVGVLLGEELRRFLIPLAAISMLPAPPLVGLSGRFGARVAALLGRRDAPAAGGATIGAGGAGGAGGDDATKLANVRAIVVGYGPVGRTLCRILLRHGVRVCVIELSHATVDRLRRLKRESVFGDASRREVLLAAGLERAQWLIVTLPNLEARVSIIANARAIAPRVRILSRARYIEERSPLEESGADQISYEEAEVAMELARLLLARLEVAPDVLEQEVRDIRSEIAVRTGFTMLNLRVSEPPNTGRDGA